MHHVHHYGADAPGLAASERLQDHDHVALAPLGAAAAPHAGLSAPRNDEPRELVGSGAGLSGQGQANTTDCANTTAQRKYFATLAARLALAGWALNSIAVGDGSVTYSASRWGMTRDLASIDALAEFADRVGAL